MKDMKIEQLKEIICKQIELLAEVSKNCNAGELSILTNAMSNLYLAYLRSSMYKEQDNVARFGDDWIYKDT